MTITKGRMKTGVILALLVISFVFANSLFQDAKAANQPSSSAPTLTSTSTLDQASEPAASPELTHPQTHVTKFAYEAVGKEGSDMPTAKTITLCNYTTPSYYGTIVQIRIYLAGISEISHVRAVIFANEPNVNFPQGGEPIAQSFETFSVASISGQWYNFTMNCPASPNTVYWLGYYSDNQTHYFFDASNNSITVTSQPKDGTSAWLPVGWAYQGKTTMSLYALYAYADTDPAATLTQLNSTNNQLTQSYRDAAFVLLIIGGETAIVVTGQARKKSISAIDSFISK